VTRLALAGAGSAGTVHALAATVVTGGHISQVLSRTADSAAALGVGLNIDHGTYAELSSRADGVIIATPAHHHAEMLHEVIGRGLPALVEKPLTTTLAIADGIIDAVEVAGVVCGYAENLLFAPCFDVATAHRATLGTLSHLSLRMLSDTPGWGHFAEALSSQALGGPNTELPGGGVLHDLGSHPLAMALALADSDAVSVSASMSSSLLGNAAGDRLDDEATVEITFADGLIATIEVSWRAETPEWDLQAAGSDGVIRMELGPTSSVELDGRDATPALLHPGLADPRIEAFGYVAQLQGFVDILNRRGGRACPLGFGRLVLDVTTAAYASAGDGGRSVPLPWSGPRDVTPLSLWRS